MRTRREVRNGLGHGDRLRWSGWYAKRWIGSTVTVRVVGFDETLAVNRGKSVSLAYVASTSSIAKRVLVLLEGSRVLHGSRSGDDEDHCRQSAQRIRRNLEAEIVAANPPLEASLRKIRKAAETFVSLAGPDARNFSINPSEFHDALGALRDAIAPEVGWLATNWKIDIEASLADMIPGARTA